MKPFSALLRASASRGLQVCLVAAIAGCSSPANVAGDYTVDITDEANGCMFNGWTEGSSASGIPVTITQSSSSMTATVMGAAGTLLTLVVGSSAFDGTVSGDGFSGTIDGTVPLGSGGCAYTIDADLDGTLSGGTNINGTITYSAKTNGASSCGSLNGCSSVQQYSGSRPPS
jgi:hypothetical protein